MDRILEAVLSDGSVIKGTQILVAMGHCARTTDMMLDRVGAPGDRQWIKVDDYMCVLSVSRDWLYAIDDVDGRATLTHVGKYQAKLAGNSIIAKACGKYTREVAKPWDEVTANPVGLAVAEGVFTDPQVAACRLSPEQATARGMRVRTIAVTMSGPA